MTQNEKIIDLLEQNVKATNRLINLISEIGLDIMLIRRALYSDKSLGYGEKEISLIEAVRINGRM